MMAANAEICEWGRRWARRANAGWQATEDGWAMVLDCGRKVEANTGDGVLKLRSFVPMEMRDWSPERLLRWQFESPAIASFVASAEAETQLTAALPLEDLTEGHTTVLLNVLAGRSKEIEPALPGAEQRHDLSVVRDWWERDHGGLTMRERDGRLSMGCQSASQALPIQVVAESVASGVRLSGEFLAGDFVEPCSALALHRFLLTLNTHITLGGMALATDGSPTFSLLLPAPLTSTTVGHGFSALLACHQRFARAVKAIATNTALAAWWGAFNNHI